MATRLAVIVLAVATFMVLARRGRQPSGGPVNERKWPGFLNYWQTGGLSSQNAEPVIAVLRLAS